MQASICDVPALTGTAICVPRADAGAEAGAEAAGCDAGEDGAALPPQEARQNAAITSSVVSVLARAGVFTSTAS
jgi:hypothetical protein